MRDSIALGQQLAHELDSLRAVVLDIEWEDYLTRTSLLEHRFLALISEGSSRYTETQRRIAEATLVCAFLKKRSKTESKKLFQRLNKLGFKNLSRKAELTLLYATLCASLGYRSEAVSTLSALAAEFKATASPVRNRVLRRVVSALNQIG